MAQSVRTGQAGGLRFLHQCRRRFAPLHKVGWPPRSPTFVDSSGGGISALRLVRSARPCAMPAKSVFVLKTKVSCPAAASGSFFRPQWQCSPGAGASGGFFLTGGGSAALVQVPPAVLSGPRMGQGRKLVRKVKIWKVLRMGLPIVENLSGLQESIFSLSRSPQLHFGQKSKKL